MGLGEGRIMSTFFWIVAVAAYLLCGTYVTGRFGFSDRDDHPGVLFCPILWPFFLLFRFVHQVYNRGSNRRFDD